MAFVCEICGKKRQVGNNVSHANNRTKRVFRPNLQTVRALVSGKRLAVSKFVLDAFDLASCKKPFNQPPYPLLLI